MRQHKQQLEFDGARRVEFYFRDGEYWKQDSWSMERWKLTELQFEELTKTLPFFRRGTNICTIGGEVLEYVFVLKKKDT